MNAASASDHLADAPDFLSSHMIKFQHSDVSVAAVDTTSRECLPYEHSHTCFSGEACSSNVLQMTAPVVLVALLLAVPAVGLQAV